MHHIAIMRKSWGLLPKILSGEKKIESRWYMSRVAPWNRIKSGETVYFKDSGSPITLKAEVSKVIQFSDLTSNKVKEILSNYGSKIGIYDTNKFFKRFKSKKYCILVFLKNPKEVKPFNIDKTGFGLMSAWISVEDVDRIKK